MAEYKIPQFDTVKLPENTEIEVQILAEMMSIGMAEVNKALINDLAEHDFMHPFHRQIFRAIKVLDDENVEAGVSTVADQMERAGVAGYEGPRLFTTLCDIACRSHGYDPRTLVPRLKEYTARRKALMIGAELVRKATDYMTPIAEALAGAGDAIAKLAMSSIREGLEHIGEIGERAFKGLEDEVNGLPVVGQCRVAGFERLNDLLGGFHAGELIVMAARPGIGKTSLGLDFCRGATEYGKKVGIFSLEMTSKELWIRMAGQHAEVNIKAMRTSKDRIALEKIRTAKEELTQRGIWIEDRSAITAREIGAQVQGFISRHGGIDLLIIDYLGLMSSSDSQKASKQNESTRIGDITRALKIMAKDLNLPIILLCQMNRNIEIRQDAKPTLADLRDSGAVERVPPVGVFEIDSASRYRRIGLF